MTTPENKGILAWFAHNHVAANLLMIGIVAAGLLVARTIRQEIYPLYEYDTVVVDMDYRGASPEEVEHSVILPIEAELRGMELIRRIHSVAREGNAKVTAEITPGYDRNRALQEITAAVQRVSMFPDDIEPPVITLGTGRLREVIRVAIHGDLDEQSLIAFARQLEDALLAEPGISIVKLRGTRRPEVRVEIPQEKLRSLDLTLGEVAAEIRQAAIDVPAGTMKTPGGDILLRTKGRSELASQFAALPIVSGEDGSRLHLGDIATIVDGFEESDNETYFEGGRAVSLAVFSTETQSPVEVAQNVQKFIDKIRPTIPPSVDLQVSWNRSNSYKERVNLLLRNGLFGLVLVILALGLFLELRVAFWTAVGIPVSILGSLLLMPMMDATINMISLFGFIITLGIVVDDAVVVGEDVFHKISEGMPRKQAAILGAKQMSVPVTFAVATNIIAFLPLLFVPGQIGQFFEILPAVVIAVFTVSLVECLLILPAHLAGGKSSPSPGTLYSRINAWQSRLRQRLDIFLEKAYSPVLDLALRYRYLTATLFVSGLGVVIAWMASGRIDFIFRPEIETFFVQAEIELPTGTPVDRVREVTFAVEEAARRALEKTGEKDILTGIMTEVADGASNTGEVNVLLVPQSQRKITSGGFVKLWRKEIPQFPDVESIFFDWIYGPGGEGEIEVELAHPDIQTLRAAASEVADAIGKFPGVVDVKKGFGREMRELDFQIKPAGHAMGLTTRDLGRQIRNAFYGAEALRQPRGREELRVMVRLPREDRRSMSGIEGLMIRTPDGGEIPLDEAAEIIRTRAPVRIERVDGGRVVDVSANVLSGVTTGNRVLAAFSKDGLPQILARYPGLRYSFEGEQREQREAMANLTWGLIVALFVIYALMAALLCSYVQALVVLLTLPWSLAGAVIGHKLLGFELSVFSVFGMIALCGMVVNGAFVLSITRNRYRDRGDDPQTITRNSALRRFRPILLTAITTFLGLSPMIMETSIQALFLVPMAISLGIGTLVSTIVTLVFIPACYGIIEDYTKTQ
jgi:multidrug efflux pump subunit AcrB